MLFVTRTEGFLEIAISEPEAFSSAIADANRRVLMCSQGGLVPYFLGIIGFVWPITRVDGSGTS